MKETPTIDDVALALGVTKSTVSKALSGKGTISAKTRDRVRHVARELGFEPNLVAQRLANGHGNPQIYLFSGTLDLGMATQKIRLARQALHDHGFEVPIYATPENGDSGGLTQADQIRQICRQRPRAILCASQNVRESVYRELEAYQQTGGIVVSYDTPVPLDCDQVVFDREYNAYQAACCLLEKGHRKIGIGMTAVPHEIVSATDLPQTQRLRGFLRALNEWGVPFQKEWLFENPSYEEGGETMARRFLQMVDRPTGLCIVNDIVAFAFMVDVMRAGVRVPDDVSIVSHDNLPITVRCPVPMTSATQPISEIAQSAADLLLERLHGYAGPPRRITLRGELVMRDSVASPPTLNEGDHP